MSQSFDDAAVWHGEYVAVGETLSGSDSQAAAWSSYDGAEWRQTLSDGSAGETGRARQLLAANGGLIAVGWVGVMHCPPGGEGAPPCDPLPIVTWTSSDAHAWTRHDLGAAYAGATFTAAATDATELRAVGTDAAGLASMWRSTDGITWMPESLGQEFEQANFFDIAWTGTTWLVGGSVGPVQQQSGGVTEAPNSKAAIWRLDESGSWQKADFGKAAWAVSELTVGANGIIATAELADTKNGAYWRSADGTDWTPLTSVPFPVASDGNAIVGQAYASGDWIAYSLSTDGQQWQGLPDQGELTTRPRWGLRPEADGAFLLGSKLLITSSDGLLWPTEVTRP
jgi:hypothetical protein